MLVSNRLLHAILDQLLRLMPSDPAHVKRMDVLFDGGLAEDEVGRESREIHESVIPSSGVVAKSGAVEKLRAAS